jgi:lipopolysaccharide export LptBFGC system permease protein LptF
MAGRRAEAFLRNELGKSPLQQMISPFPYYNSALRRHWLIDPFDPRHPERLSHVKIIQERTDGTREEEIYADKAEWLDGHWWLHRARVQQYDPHGQPAGPLLPPSEHPLEMPDWSETPADFANEVCPWELLSSLEMFKFLKTHPDLSRENRAGKSVDLYSRLAMPWTCFVVVLLGVPVGARTARQGLMMSVFLAIGLFFAFYAAVHVGFFLGKRQLLWPWLSAWLPNIAFSAAGLMLLFKMR